MIRLGVNIDHVATVRNARGEFYPDPVQAAAMAELGGADNITCHLREDRRHIKDHDVQRLKDTISVPLNFEMAVTPEMIAIAKKTKPHYVTLVPEKREELTTEGGMDVEKHADQVRRATEGLKEAGILVSLFVEADRKTIDFVKSCGADAIEIHTGDFCHNMDRATTTAQKLTLVKEIEVASLHAHELGLQVHLGHGLHYGNANWMQLITHAEEANIGHAIVSRAIFTGLKDAVAEMKALLNDPSKRPYGSF